MHRFIRYTVIIVVPLLLLLLIFFLWSWGLRRLVARRTGELRNSERQYRQLFENAPIGIFATSSKGEVLAANRHMVQTLGLRDSQDALEHYNDLGHELYVNPARRDEFIAQLRKSGEVESFEYLARTVDDRVVWLSMNARLAETREDGTFVIEGFTKDVTAQKQAAEHIIHLNQILRVIRNVNQLIVRRHNRDKLIADACKLFVENRAYTFAMIILLDENSSPTAWNYAGATRFTNKMPDVSKMLENGELPSCLEQNMNSAKIAKIVQRESTCHDCPLFSGESEGCAIFTPLTYDSAVYGYLLTMHEDGDDVDRDEKELLVELADDLGFALHSLTIEKAREKAERDREKLQEQMMQMQKMESVGRLAGGVAHDFNNMLSVIIGNAQMMMEAIPENDPKQGDLREIMTAAEKSIQITRQLLAFARRQNVSPKLVDLNQIVANSLNMLRRLIGEDIELTWHPATEKCMVRIDPGQIDQVLANLCVNARDAIRDVGFVAVETGHVTFDRDYCKQNLEFVPGSFVMLSVTDDGCGMDKKTQENVFEPFFTTKDIGKGTGLGLATVYGIVKQNNGFVNVYSEVGQGTTFKIYLPAEDAEQAADEAQTVFNTPEGHGETILVVEDNDAIMRMMKLILTRLGYVALTACKPVDAIDLAQEHSDQIKLLITDVIMPDMNGRDLANAILQKHPNIKVLYMSGYTANVIAHHGVLDEGVHFLQKPFSKEQLAEKINEVLHGGKSV